jgi:hypothetical protein
LYLLRVRFQLCSPSCTCYESSLLLLVTRVWFQLLTCYELGVSDLLVRVCFQLCSPSCYLLRAWCQRLTCYEFGSSCAVSLVTCYELGVSDLLVTRLVPAVQCLLLLVTSLVSATYLLQVEFQLCSPSCYLLREFGFSYLLVTRVWFQLCTPSCYLLREFSSSDLLATSLFPAVQSLLLLVTRVWCQRLTCY